MTPRKCLSYTAPYTFKFGTAGGSYCCEKTAIVSLWIRCCDQPSLRFNITAIELEKPVHDVHNLDNAIFKQHSYLKPIEANLPNKNSAIDILIGLYYANLMKVTGYIQHPHDPEHNPTGVKTPLGWYVLDLNLILPRPASKNIFIVFIVKKVPNTFNLFMSRTSVELYLHGFVHA